LPQRDGCLRPPVEWVEPLRRNPSSPSQAPPRDGFRKGSTHPTSIAAALAERGTIALYVAAPILRIHAQAYHSVKRRMRPIAHTRDVAVFDWVEMDVIDVTREIFFVAQGVLPVSSLPNAAIASEEAALRNSLGIRQAARERGFY